MSTLNFVLIISAVLVVITKQSNGNEEDIQMMVEEFDKNLSDADYRTRHVAALDTIAEIIDEANRAEQRVNKENEKNAINEVRKTFLDSIKSIAVSGERPYNANQKATESTDAESSKQALKKANSAAKQGVGIALSGAFQRLGAATEIAGKYSIEPLKQTIKILVLSELEVYSGLDEIEKVAIVGLESGGAAKKQGITTSIEAIEVTGSVFYNYLLKAAKVGFGGIDRSRPAPQVDKYSGTEAADISPEASSAIEYVNNTAENIASQLSESPSLDAINVAKDGIIAAIRGVAAAIQKPQEALQAVAIKTGKLLELKSSAKSIRQASKNIENDFAYACANAYLSLGIAGDKVGGQKKDNLDGAMSAIKDGCILANKSFQTALFLAMKGLENGRTATQTGITAAIDAVSTAAFAAYAEFMTAADIAFDVLNS